MRHRCLSLAIATLLLLTVACTPSPAVGMPTPTAPLCPTCAPVLSPTAPPSRTPTATPQPPRPATPTPVPTIDRAAVATQVREEQPGPETVGIEPLCLRSEDTDGDGESEWVGLYLQPGDSPPLAAFVLDGETWHELQPVEREKHGLGEYAACELDIQDLNADGQVDILVWGHSEGNVDLLHVFSWNGEAYALVAPFEGNAGVRLEEVAGTLASSVVVAYKAGSGLVWEVEYTWDGSSYGWTWDRYRWFYVDRPHRYVTDTPEHAVISYYLALDDRDLPGAYGLLTASGRGALSYEEWVAGFATAVSVEVSNVHELSRSGENVANVAAQVRAYDNVDGRIVASLRDTEWTVSSTAHGWRLDAVSATLLDQWEVEYHR